MFANGAAQHHIAPSASTASAVSALFVNEFDCDMLRVALPRPEIHLVVRIGPPAQNGLDVHAMGVRHKAHRKLIRRGQRTVMARLRLGAHVAVLGVPATAIAGRVVALEDVWGDAAARRLCDRLADARDMVGAAAVLDRAIAERVALASERRGRAQLALDSAALLTSANVNTVASKLGVSDRQLRRVFRETIGMSPKRFARLARFHHALGSACGHKHASWANIAADSGYYDQAHLIAEFREITGATPQALLNELRAHPLLDQPARDGAGAMREPPSIRARSQALDGSKASLRVVGFSRHTSRGSSTC
jgi:AraC-like DNA-binding protein